MKISKIEQAVKSIVVNNNTWEDVCAGYFTWFNVENTTEIFEEIIGSNLAEFKDKIQKNGCIYQSVIQLWETSLMKDIRNLTKKEVLEDVTKAIKHKITDNILLDITPLLSGIIYDKKGRVKGANATILNWMLKKSNPNSANWELEFINRVLHSNITFPPGMEIYAIASRSYIDSLHQILNSNLTVLCCGISLIAVYVMVMIGKCNALEQRIYLSIMGVFVVGQAILSSYGVCYYLGYSYGPIHSILPFLLLGIGVDNMFVIMQSLVNLPETDQSAAIPIRIAKAIQQAGMSITVTSFTNIIAFAFGITTVMPTLRSFYAFATLGILFLYIYEIIFFVSCLVYDEKRLEARKDGCFCRPKLNWKPNECSQRNTQQIIFENYIGPGITKTTTKVIILLITATCLCVNTWAVFQLEQNFDPLWYLNQDSYPIQFNDKLKQYFPKYGKRVGIYMTGVDYYEDRKSLFELVEVLKHNKFINNNTLDPWFIAYEKWLNATNKGDIDSSEEYYNILTEFLLLTKEGQAYIKDINFDKLPAGEYNITTSQIPIQHVMINTTSEQIQAMQLIRESIQAINFSHGHDYIAIFSPDYVSWTANKVIGEELIRNLGLEILTIGVVILIFLRNLQTSFWVICCVFFTLIDLLGTMYFLNLTIEMSSSIMILLCVGLAVDYAAHMGLEFIRAKGSKKERAIETLSIIGPAVFNGGLSTFLAFVLLGSSDAYLFNTFFKLFTCVVIFGLFHGLLFLPVILSLLGPEERIKKEKNETVVKEQNGYCNVPLSQSEKDMSDAFEEIQAIKIKRNSLREKLQKRKRERHELFTLTSTTPVSSTLTNDSSLSNDLIGHSHRSDHNEYERDVLCILHESLPNLPITSAELIDQLRKNLNADVCSSDIHKILEKFAAQDIVKIKEVTENGVFGYTVLSVAESQSSYQSQSDDTENPESAETSASELNDYGPAEKQPKLDKKNAEDIMSLISMPTIREKENKKVGEQILDLLSKQTSKEKSLAERFRSQGGAQVMEFCPHGTRIDCVKLNGGPGFAEKCKKLHFKKIIQSHTDESLGDCSFLNTCFHMDTCKYVHYEVDGPTTQPKESNETDNANNSTVNKNLTIDSKNGNNTSCPASSGSLGSELTLYPPQWIQCDLRYLDMTVLGKFAVIMADPPWDIHMELPYGTMSDDEMRQLGIPALQDEGLLFLWVTGRAMELGRECLQLWGYERVDEIIWVKTNQLQRIIRTGRTGHWLNHGKEHCLVGMKGNPRINRGLDSDVIVAEVRATSHKPDEIYGIIERMSPGTRKIELFGRPHNVQPNWITLGNQVDGVHLIDPQLIKAFKKRYPDGNSMKPSKS